jgi:hypothetical protein
MTSDFKIAANQINAKKSTGPRTRSGKARASRNAARHGLAATSLFDNETCDKVDRIATMIYHDRAHPFLREQAVIIAESQILLTRIRAARIDAIQRMRAPQPPPLLPGYPTRDEMKNILGDFAAGNFRKVANIMNRAASSLRAAFKMPDEKREEIYQSLSNAYRHEMALQKGDLQEPDGITCFCQGLPELLKLERYERRALSRRGRAIRIFALFRDAD